ncbi:MFS transporter [Actinomadura spongiicola]|uniref:MFS transporter n=1 Tax=Actinomadura spongiicola TaxID=2303421 RepID=UPI001313DD2B|nr:MFS transporter [Actinomadura spongiicola]
MTTAQPDVDASNGTRLHALRERLARGSGQNFAIISTASAVSQVGSMGVAAAGPLLALALTKSPIAAGCVTAASVLPGLLLHLPAGILVDRVDRRLVMLTSQIVRFISAFVACLCLTSVSNVVVVLVIAALIDGSCAVFYEVAEIAVVPDLVSDDFLHRAIGSNEAKLNASMLIGRPLGGAFLGVHPVVPYAVDAITSLFPIMALFVVGRRKRVKEKCDRELLPPAAEPVVVAEAEAENVPPERGEKGQATDAAVGLRPALSRLAHDDFSCAVVFLCVLANFFFQVIVLLQIFQAEQEGLPSYLVGLLLACTGLGGILGAIASPRIIRKMSAPSSVVVGLMMWVTLVWIMALYQNPIFGLALWGLCSIIGAHINVALRTHQAKVLGKKYLGRVTGFTRFLSVGAVALGAFSGGWIINAIGVRPTSFVVGGAFTIPLVVLIFLPIGMVRDWLVVQRAIFSVVITFCRHGGPHGDLASWCPQSEEASGLSAHTSNGRVSTSDTAVPEDCPPASPNRPGESVRSSVSDPSYPASDNGGRPAESGHPALDPGTPDPVRSVS